MVTSTLPRPPRRPRPAQLALRSSAIAALAAVTVACAGGQRPASTSTHQAAISTGAFKAVLFPYIPDSANDQFASLIAYLQNGFTSAYPGKQVQVIINSNLDVYDYAPGGVLSRLLGSGAEAAQVVEVDTLLMSTLVHNRWVQPTQLPNLGVFPTAQQAASVDSVAYGAPTYLCSNVVYAYSASINQASNATNLLAMLTAINPGHTALVGNYNGSWTLPGFYVDAWGDTNGTAGLQPAYRLPLDQRTMSFFPSIVNSCVSGGKNPCLDGSYANTEAETLFATHAANAFIGYTERLFYIRSVERDALPTVVSDPIGGGSHPTMFVDALVFNPSCTGDCLATAQAFATYMSSPEVRAAIAFSLDAPAGTLPRYLLQANQAFYTMQPAASDPMYRQYQPIVQIAQPYPNTDFPQSRKELQAALMAVLSPTGAQANDAH